MSGDTLRTLVFLAGLGQIALFAASLTIPSVLGWRQELAKVRPLVRQLFWVYAAYILVTNLSFGLLSALAPGWLLDGSPLAGAVSGFMAVYWGARLLLQFTYFDRHAVARTRTVVWAEIALVALFAGLTLVYGTACWSNLHGRPS
jgi:hypothetical protein